MFLAAQEVGQVMKHDINQMDSIELNSVCFD